jgi:hypothetical protein
MTVDPEERVYLRALAELIDRRMNTIRSWDLPPDLQPQRDGRGWRYWLPAQVDEIRRWMVAEGKGPGHGLRNGRPSLEATQQMLAKMRQPRPSRRMRA